MTKRYRYIIGIDPGTNTGVAIWDRTDKKFLKIATMDILGAVDTIKKSKEDWEDIFVRIEDPHQRKWFGPRSRAKMQGAGSVKRDFKIIRDFLTRNGIPFHAYHPKDVRTKVDAKTFQDLTGYTGRTSSHARDAAMAVFGF